MAAEALPGSLQESVLTTLVFDEQFGAVVAAQVEADHFDQPLREIAEAVLKYRRQYGKPPGQAHLDDMFGRAMEEGSRRAPQLRRIVTGMAAQSIGLNAEYVASRVGEFVRSQTLKQALLAASERFQQGGENKLEEVEVLLHAALRPLAAGLDNGLFLNDAKQTLNFLEIQPSVMSLGIPQLDALKIGPARKELLLYIGPKGSGKTWFAVHCGKSGLRANERVLHVTLETRVERVVGRYYQSIFAASVKEGRINQTVFELDQLGRLSGFRLDQFKPKLSFDDPNIRKKLRSKIEGWDLRLGRILVKDFPTGTLTVPQLDSYLDYLEYTVKFVPTLLILDSPDNMKLPVNDFRLATGRMFVDLRGMAGRRNLSMVCTTQGNRASISAKKVGADMVAEDITKVQTADNVFTFSRTEEEKDMNVGRLTVANARNAEDGAVIALTQSYATGQYIMDSIYPDAEYWRQLKFKAGEEE